MKEASVYFDYVSYEKSAPAVVVALKALGKAIDDSGLDKALTEVVKIRVSQMNNCAFCLQLHFSFGRKVGLSQEKMESVSKWREVDLFSDRERAALDWSEALTLMVQQKVPSTSYDELVKQFTESEIAFLTAAIGNINAWNRIAGGLKFPA
ncbi:carboxymuconolactone decarboxylase family protein [Marinomonas spartinae]|uniref:carboxymuconolactone decarboxylase family protein n=1 Tax=Marinomonas spartinae TaxID=1792290 RepID=UPI0018F20572|nr:carboxymuconolactone decarboxylase family protein [Marinomonas spartinae]MBJ7553933.1 carboxymuconolactone decarboxylase family protein [Marinomonas spartinae]